MANPYMTLGIAPTADVTVIRSAYHARARECHPDQFQDEAVRQAMHRRMVQLNSAYRSALDIATNRSGSHVADALSLAEALTVAEGLLASRHPENALRQLLRSERRSAQWYDLQGRVLMAMEQYLSAAQSFREACRLAPGESLYRQRAAAAEQAVARSKTLPGRIRHFLRMLTRPKRR